MAAKATELKVTSTSRNLGEFHVERFNMFNDEDMLRYAALRTTANDASTGVRIEQIREYTRKSTTHEGEGETSSSTTVEEIFLLVHYWIRKPTTSKSNSNADSKEARHE